jgi:hypothetical protein
MFSAHNCLCIGQQLQRRTANNPVCKPTVYFRQIFFVISLTQEILWEKKL